MNCLQTGSGPEILHFTPQYACRLECRIPDLTPFALSLSTGPRQLYNPLTTAMEEPMKMRSEKGRSEDGLWRKVFRYALGIVIESATVVAISLLALLLMFIIKAIVA